MRLSRRWKSQRGTAMVEFAIVLPIFLFIVWCVVDFARAYYTQNSLASAVREGARYAAVRDLRGTKAERDAIVAETKSVVTKSFNAFGGAPIPPDSIKVDTASMPEITVKVSNYEWLTTTPISIFAGGKVSMTRKATFRWERDGS